MNIVSRLLRRTAARLAPSPRPPRPPVIAELWSAGALVQTTEVGVDPLPGLINVPVPPPRVDVPVYPGADPPTPIMGRRVFRLVRVVYYEEPA